MTLSAEAGGAKADASLDAEGAPVAKQGKRNVGTFQLDQLRLAHTKRFVEYVKSLGLLERDEQLAASAPDILRQCDTVGPEQPSPKRARLVASESDMHSWICSARHLLLRPGLGKAAPDTAADWRQEAVARWGSRVPEERSISDWQKYVKSRLPALTCISPLDIMQERYAYDAWRLLVACTLMSRINSERIKEEAIGCFFASFPSPSQFLGRDSQAEMRLQQTLRPLGLVDNRVKTIDELSHRFLEMPSFDCGNKKGVNKITGCGPFAVDSFLIFFRGCLLAETADASCKKYLEWRGCEDSTCEKQVENLGTPPKQMSPTPDRQVLLPSQLNGAQQASLFETPAKPRATVFNGTNIVSAQAHGAQQTSLLTFFKNRS